MNRARTALFLYLDLLTRETDVGLTGNAVRVPGPPAIRRRVDRCYSFWESLSMWFSRSTALRACSNWFGGGCGVSRFGQSSQ